MDHNTSTSPAIEFTSSPPRSVGRAWVRLLRPTDWSKNVLVFAALVFSQKLKLENTTELLAATLTFLAFGLLASGFYAFNDALDVESDRKHPVKRRRPVASGIIAPRTAAMSGLVLIVCGLILALLVNHLVGIICACYCLLQLAYNLRLKRAVMVDVVALSLGFALRAAAGAAAVHVEISAWLIMCVFFLCMFLGFVKRLSDMTSAQNSADTGWEPAAKYAGERELNWLLGGTAALTVMTYLMYSLSPHAAKLFGARAVGLALLTPLVVIAIHRFYRRANLGLSDRPLDALLQDRGVQACVILFAVGVYLSLYISWVGQVLDRLFLQ